MAPGLVQVLREADAYFMGHSALHDTVRRLATILDEMGIPYAVAGALALGFHGRVRLTEDVDVLIRREQLAQFKSAWLGRGYLDVTPGLKAVRDTVTRVKVDFLLTGEYPGDGRVKPIVFPDPAEQAELVEGLRVLPLDTLMTLKIASGMSAPHRGQDLVDVMELIRVRALPRVHADRLPEYVRGKFLELWDLAQIRDDY